MKKLHIFADENIPHSQTAFAEFGDVSLFNGRELKHADLQHADVLLVRSVTQVNAALLQDTPVQFVGSATIGFDHIDLDYLKQHKITFARAPGSNAVSAAEYVISSLLILARQQGFKLADKRVGIIGCGNVGSRVQQRLEALGVQCLPHDPPLQARQASTGDDHYVDRATVLTADIITLHVPLVHGGLHPTYELANQAFFEQFSDQGLFINTSRGDAVVESALKWKLNHAPDFNAILDVWANEPDIDTDLLQQVSLGSPHIAGYSLDGKLRGTEMIYRALCTHLQTTASWTAQQSLPPAAVLALHFSDSISDDQAIYQAVMSCYDSRDDDALLRQCVQDQSPHHFDQLRKQYRARREFSTLAIHLAKKRVKLHQQLTGLGFNCQFAPLSFN